MDVLKSPNGGGGGRPRPFAVVAFWAGFVLAENSGDTVTRAQVSRGMFVCTRAGSLDSLPMVNGGGLVFPQERRNGRNRDSRGTALRNTNDCRLWGKRGSKLGAHTSLSRTRRGG